MFLKQVLFIAFITSLTSCSFFNSNKINEQKVVAKVNETYLFKEDVLAFLPKNNYKKDSLLLVANFINSWAKQQLLLDKAKMNLKENLVDIDLLVNKYKEDLLINKYREAVVSQNLDTIVGQVDIDSFYVKNKELFTLNEELIQLKFIHFSNTLLDKEKIISLFKSEKKEDLEELIAKEIELKSYHFNDSMWIKYTDALNIIPPLNEFKIATLQNKNKVIVKEDSLNVYLVKIKKILFRNRISPKSYVEPTIRQMILHTRKLKLLKKIEQTLLNDAIKNGTYEIYK